MAKKIFMISQIVLFMAVFSTSLFAQDITEQLPAPKDAKDYIDTFTNSKDRDERLRALYNIAASRDPSAIQYLTGALKDPDVDIRKTATYALGTIGDKKALPALLEAMKDKEPSVRESAAFGLGTLGDAQTLAFLEEFKKQETDPDVLFTINDAIDLIKYNTGQMDFDELYKEEEKINTQGETDVEE